MKNYHILGYGSEKCFFVTELFACFHFCLRTPGADFSGSSVQFFFLDVDLYLSEGSNIRMAPGGSGSGSAAANFTNSRHKKIESL